jgi:NAD-dependent deacetylase
LHGSIIEWRCTSTGRTFTPEASPLPTFPVPSPFALDGLLRPDVVWFGEMLDERIVEEATRMAAACDMFFSIGTSSVVYPAAGFVGMAAEIGAFCVEVNQESTPVSSRVDAVLRASAGEALPQLVELAFGRDHA